MGVGGSDIEGMPQILFLYQQPSCFFLSSDFCQLKRPITGREAYRGVLGFKSFSFEASQYPPTPIQHVPWGVGGRIGLGSKKGIIHGQHKVPCAYSVSTQKEVEPAPYPYPE